MPLNKEIKPIQSIIPCDFKCNSYIDDAFLIYPYITRPLNIIRKFNKIVSSRKFPFNEKTDNALLFQDISFVRNRLYLKPLKSNNNSLINFFSHHYNEIKSGIILGFYLRVLNICNPEYLPEESYIENIFKALNYSNLFIHNAERKAHKINKAKNKTKFQNIYKIYGECMPGVIFSVEFITQISVMGANYYLTRELSKCLENW